MKIVESLPGSFQEFFVNVAGISRFTRRFFKQLLKPPLEFREILEPGLPAWLQFTISGKYYRFYYWNGNDFTNKTYHGAVWGGVLAACHGIYIYNS